MESIHGAGQVVEGAVVGFFFKEEGDGGVQLHGRSNEKDVFVALQWWEGNAEWREVERKYSAGSRCEKSQ